MNIKINMDTSNIEKAFDNLIKRAENIPKERIIVEGDTVWKENTKETLLVVGIKDGMLLCVPMGIDVETWKDNTRIVPPNQVVWSKS